MKRSVKKNIKAIDLTKAKRKKTQYSPFVSLLVELLDTPPSEIENENIKNFLLNK